MTPEGFEKLKDQIVARILREAEPIQSIEALPEFLREHGTICVCVVDGKVCMGNGYPYLHGDRLAETTPERYAAGISFDGVPLSDLIRQGRVRAAMVPM